MSRGVQLDPLPPHWVGGGGGYTAPVQTEHKFAAKMQYVYLSVIGFTDIWTLLTWNKSCSILYVNSKKCK
jgi:hypothetical protein